MTAILEENNGAELEVECASPPPRFITRPNRHGGNDFPPEQIPQYPNGVEYVYELTGQHGDYAFYQFHQMRGIQS